MKNRIAAVAALVVLVAACAVPLGKAEPLSPEDPDHCDRTFVVSAEFPDQEQAAIRRAANRWNQIAVEQFCVRPPEDSENPEEIEHGIFRMEVGGDVWKSLGNPEIIGVHWYPGDRIAVVDNLDIGRFELVMLHEFGHAHSLSHTQAPSIMHSSLGTATDFTSNDLAECQRVGACRKEDSNGGL